MAKASPPPSLRLALFDWREGSGSDEREKVEEVAIEEGLAQREKRKKREGGAVACAITPHYIRNSHEKKENRDANAEETSQQSQTRFVLFYLFLFCDGGVVGVFGDG